MDINNDLIANALKGTDPKAKTQGKSGDGPAFGEFLKDSLEGAIDTQHKGERVTADAVAGNADMVDVLQAVTEAETTLNTVLAIRDRLVSAYQEVMRTPI